MSAAVRKLAAAVAKIGLAVLLVGGGSMAPTIIDQTARFVAFLLALWGIIEAQSVARGVWGAPAAGAVEEDA